ncbi:DUF6356 family protein [Phreatobacter aquaticus]|uniref:DUF6356 family protein n=1 Tax=Phreatobacter aquaticus TaxID=2570229 RepID=UPI00208F78EC|nr:DUF6356 family protein [Phreatobacter aquaticus]
MFERLRKAFMAHPESVNESYFEHFRAAMGYAGTFAFCAFCAFVHAFLPFLFEKTASTIVKKMVADMNARMNAPQGKVEAAIQPAE